MNRKNVISYLILFMMFLGARQIPISELSKAETEEMSRRFWRSFEYDVIGPFKMDNIGFEEGFNIMLQGANVVLDKRSGLRASGSFGAMPYTYNVPRTFKIPATTISNAFSKAVEILDCSLDCSRGYICIEQKMPPCPSIHLPIRYPIAVLRSPRHDYPSKRSVTLEAPLDTFDAKKIMGVFRKAKSAALTAICCEYFLKFPDGQILGVATDDTKREVFGFDFGWGTNSVLEADDGSPHKLKLFYQESQDDEKSNEELRKELYQIIMRYSEKGQ